MFVRRFQKKYSGLNWASRFNSLPQDFAISSWHLKGVKKSQFCGLSVMVCPKTLFLNFGNRAVMLVQAYHLK